MKQYILKRILFAIPTMLGVLVVVFLVIRMIPGDPAAIYLGEKATKEQIEAFREDKGLNEPLIVQVWIMIKDFAKGDLGVSFVQKRPVLEIIKEKFPHTLKLSTAGIIFASFFGLLFGVIAAIKRGSWVDLSIVGASTLFMSMPSSGRSWSPPFGRQVPSLPGYHKAPP
jgi:ABC-type dipeptide/oligopeptide/nickel transport system permease component